MRGIFLLSVTTFLVIFSGDPAARIWQVMPDSTGSVINIQAGIDSCAAGDTVLAAPGTYRGDGNWDLDFKGKPIVVMSMSRFDALVTDATIIDCEDISTHRGFHFHSGETESSILEGFEIINGGAASVGWDDGGAILCESSSPTIQFNVISRCAAIKGGGIASFSCSPVINNNQISQCYVVSDGGGIYCRDGSPRIENNTLYSNDCHMGGGGGILLWTCSDAYISGNDIRYNYSASDYKQNRSDSALPTASPSTISAPGATLGGGLWVVESSVLIEDNIITNNGGGITADYSNLEIHNNEIGNNSSCGIYCWDCETDIDGNNIHHNDGSSQLPGGIALNSSLHSSISNNVISNNNSDDYTGGIYYNGVSTSAITDNLIIGNWSGGIVCYSSILISGNHIKQNFAGVGADAAGISCRSGSPRIINNVIEENNGFGYYTGGIYCTREAPVIEQNTIVNNIGFAAIRCPSGSNASIKNCIIANNTQGAPELGGGGIYTESPDITVSCCDLFNNGDIEYVGIPDQTGINGNFSANPLFCPSEDEYYLHVLSPCSAGNHPYDNSCGLIGALGVGCDYVATLLLDHSVSIGRSAATVTWSVSGYRESNAFTLQRAKGPAWQYADIPDPPIAGDGSSFSFVDNRIVPGESYRYRVSVLDETGEQILFETDPINVPRLPLTLNQNYPNPFNPSTSITYFLPADGRVTLNIFDVSGRLVARLADEAQDQGHHSIGWDGLDGRGKAMSSGTYFYRLTMGKETLSRKMVLLR